MALPLCNGCVLLLAGVALFASGCGSDETIHSYKVSKTTERDAKRTAAYRILGALYPAKDPVWYFKFAGSIEELAKHEADFDKLASSVRLPGGATVPAFDLPTGWKKTGSRTRGGFTTDEVLKFGQLEVTITNIPGGGLKANLNRWVEQVDADVDANDIASIAKPFEAAGGKGLRVDLRGPKNPTAGGGPMMKPR